MNNVNAARLAQLVLYTGLLLFAGPIHAQSSASLVPVVSLLLNEPLTDRSNIQCTLELLSISPSAGSSIPVDGIYSATYSYQLRQRPLDVEVQISASVLGPLNGDGSQSGVTLGSAAERFIVGFDEGAESMSGQFTVSSVNDGINQTSDLRDLITTCIFFTLFDEMDAETNPGPSLGSRVQFASSSAAISNTLVNWILQSSGPQ